MVYIKHWHEFHSQSIDLFRNAPTKSRYLVKVHPSSQWLILKVTDDRTTLKYRTRSTVILNRFESFQKDMSATIANQPLPSVLEAEASASKSTNQNEASKGDEQSSGVQDVEMKDKASTSAGGTTTTTTSGGGGGGGGGKKKKKKGKK